MTSTYKCCECPAHVEIDDLIIGPFLLHRDEQPGAAEWEKEDLWIEPD